MILPYKDPEKKKQYEKIYRQRPYVKARNAEKARKSYKKNPEKHIQAVTRSRKKNPDLHRAINRKSFRKHKTKRLQHESQSLKERRIRVLTYYSKGTPKCKICEVKEIPFLAIDHVYGRKAMGHSRKTQTKVHFRELDKNHPKGYQVLCHNCNVMKWRLERKKNLSKNPRAVIDRNYKHRKKKQVLGHYSNGKLKCACCGFAQYDGLSIDHIEGRKKWGHGDDMKGFKLYHWLKKNNFPKGFQVLCMNCNQAKRDNSICPHEKYKKNI